MYIGNQPLSQAFVTDQFSGNGSTTAFTMSVAPANTASVLVAVSGVLQDPSTYSVSGTTLTFSAAPPTGTGNISARYLGIPASGVTTTAYRTITEFTATAGQTTFTPASYTVGFIQVYRNGVLLGSADYTASNGTTVVLAVGATAGDLVTTISFYVSSVLNAIPAVTGSVGSTYIAAGAVGSAQLAAGAVGNTQLATDAVQTVNILNANVTPAKLSQPLTSGTTQITTSGTSIDFTSIPSWVKRITVMFNGVSTSGTSHLLAQVGNGSVVTSGYSVSTGTAINSAGSTFYASSTAGGLIYNGSAANIYNGHIFITTLGSNIWVMSHTIGGTDASRFGGGGISLGGTLDRVRITTANGTDTFDAGSVNILYE